MKKLNIANLVPDDFDGTSPWGDLIYDDGCLVSSYAAQACLKELADAWNDDFGQNRQYVLDTLDRAIKHLQQWRKAFEAVVLTEDMLDDASDLLASSMSDRLISPAILTLVSHKIDDASKQRGAYVYDSALNQEQAERFVSALAMTAFEPSKEAK